MREDFLLEYKDELIAQGLMINWHDNIKKYTVSFIGKKYRTFIDFIVWYGEFQETEWLFHRDEFKLLEVAKPIIDKVIQYAILQHELEIEEEKNLKIITRVKERVEKV